MEKKKKWEYEDEGNHEHMTVKCKWCSKEIQVPFEEPPNKYGYGCWECFDKEDFTGDCSDL